VDGYPLARLASSSSLGTSLADLCPLEVGVGTSVVVAPAFTSDLQQIAIDGFRHAIHRARGAEIPVVGAAEAARLPESIVRFLLDSAAVADCQGFATDETEEEEFCLASIGKTMCNKSPLERIQFTIR
jgi:hypothetical protein